MLLRASPFIKCVAVIAWPIFISAVLLVSSASAQGGPPMITDDTETVPSGHFEINTAFTIERGADGEILGTPLVDFNYGLSEHFQLKIEIPWVLLHQFGQPSIGGLGNTNVGVRWRFRDQNELHRIALSIYPQLEFNNPTSSVRRGLVDRGPSVLVPLQWQTTIGKYGLNGDVGYRLKRGDDELIYGVVLGREFKYGIEVLGEIHGSGPRRSLGESEVVYNFGARVPMSKHLSLLLSGGRSIRSHHDLRFIGYAGLQVTF
ncbi:MAG: hypothetical protein ABJA02_01720 [Acidobacteriota bacterium]